MRLCYADDAIIHTPRIRPIQVLLLAKDLMNDQQLPIELLAQIGQTAWIFTDKRLNEFEIATQIAQLLPSCSPPPAPREVLAFCGAKKIAPCLAAIRSRLGTSPNIRFVQNIDHLLGQATGMVEDLEVCWIGDVGWRTTCINQQTAARGRPSRSAGFCSVRSGARSRPVAIFRIIVIVITALPVASIKLLLDKRVVHSVDAILSKPTSKHSQHGVVERWAVGEGGLPNEVLQVRILANLLDRLAVGQAKPLLDDERTQGDPHRERLLDTSPPNPPSKTTSQRLHRCKSWPARLPPSLQCIMPMSMLSG